MGEYRARNPNLERSSEFREGIGRCQELHVVLVLRTA